VARSRGRRGRRRCSGRERRRGVCAVRSWLLTCTAQDKIESNQQQRPADETRCDAPLSVGFQPPADAARHSDAVMTNLIGSDVERWREFAAEPATAVHLYGKSEARQGRKMGHVTRLLPTVPRS